MRVLLKTPALEIRGRRLEWGRRTYLMGVINITPDSFSGDGLLPAEPVSPSEVSSAATDLENEGGFLQAALEQGRQFVVQGADILDIGGESTRPGAQPVGVEAELKRVIPVIRLLSVELEALISVDTYRAPVAEAALQAGAHIVNDVWGLRADPDLAAIAARHNAPVILMHNRSSWAHAEIREQLGGRYVGVPYTNLLEDIRRELLESVDLARAAGIPDAHILLDPGIGFGKTVEQNLELIDRLDEVRSLGFPVLLGVSRKSFIGYTLNLPPDQRLEGTAAAVAVGIARGADIIRVHDVAFMSRVARMADAIVR